jgi:hypothetical protein
MRGQLSQAPHLVDSEGGGLSIRLQIRIIFRDDVPAFGRFGVGCGCKERFEAAENLVCVRDPCRVVVQPDDTQIGDHADDAQTRERNRKTHSDFARR